MAKMIFTSKSIEQLPLSDRRVQVYDAKSDLGLRIENGRKTFFWSHRVQGVGVFRALGTFPAVSVDAARGEANRLSAELQEFKQRLRRDPAAENPFHKREGELTLQGLFKKYVEEKIPEAKRPTRAAHVIKLQFEKYLGHWKNRKLSSVRRRDVLALRRNLGEKHKVTANRTVALLGRLYAFARGEEVYQGENPTKEIRRYHEAPRERFLQPSELPAFFAALKKEANRDVRDFVWLALWTGARRSDVLAMRWEHISLEDNKWNVPADSKGGAYTVALSVEPLEILKARLARRRDGSPWIFPGSGKSGHLAEPKHGWRRVCARAGLADLHIHDLRRTHASYIAAKNFSLPIIGKALGHRSPSATAIYARLNLDPVREAVAQGNAAILAAANGGKKRKQKLLTV